MSKIVYTIFNPRNQQVGLPNSLGFLDASGQKSFTVEEDSIEEAALTSVIASGVVTLVSAAPAISTYGPANPTTLQASSLQAMASGAWNTSTPAYGTGSWYDTGGTGGPLWILETPESLLANTISSMPDVNRVHIQRDTR